MHRGYPRLFGLVILVAVFGVGHHIDHVIRGKHIGWPLVAEVTPFTSSLGSYPLVALWLYASPMAGYVALSWLIRFLLLLIGRAIYAARLLTRRQQAPMNRPAARGKKPTKRSCGLDLHAEEPATGIWMLSGAVRSRLPTSATAIRSIPCIYARRLRTSRAGRARCPWDQRSPRLPTGQLRALRTASGQCGAVLFGPCWPRNHWLPAGSTTPAPRCSSNCPSAGSMMLVAPARTARLWRPSTSST